LLETQLAPNCHSLQTEGVVWISFLSVVIEEALGWIGAKSGRILVLMEESEGPHEMIIYLH